MSLVVRYTGYNSRKVQFINSLHILCFANVLMALVLKEGVRSCLKGGIIATEVNLTISEKRETP
jgi:hypothetical protein